MDLKVTQFYQQMTKRVLFFENYGNLEPKHVVSVQKSLGDSA